MDQVVTYKRPNRALANLRRPWLPHISASRVPNRRETEALINVLGGWKAAHLLLCAHDYMLPIAHVIGRYLRVPIILRSHNDEYRALTASARGSHNIVRRAFLHLDAWRLRLSNGPYLRRVQSVALLSADDVTGYRTVRDRTSVVGPILARPSADGPRQHPIMTPPINRFLLFVGALDTPQTLHGLAWFLDQVAPRVVFNDPMVTIRIVGRNAPPELVHRISGMDHVDFRGEVDDVYEEIRDARAFINPVHLGSGVNMKMGPPAELGIPIVTTEFGLRGLSELSSSALVSRTPEGFADDCVRILEDDDLWSQLHQAGPRVLAHSYSAHAFVQGMGRLASMSTDGFAIVSQDRSATK